MTSDKIYRYVSFESFVDMVQTKQLTLLHPTLYEDPKEMWVYYQYQKILPTSFDEAFLQMKKAKISKVQMCNTFIQCWTSLSDETDAMWRIYSHNKLSLRISCLLENTSKLKNVICNSVDYSTNLDEISPEFDYTNRPEDLFITKRRAFSHEHEVRLIQTMHVSKNEWDNILKQMDFYEGVNVEEVENRDGEVGIIAPDEYFEIQEELNLKIQKNAHKVDYSHIENFIDDVLVNPFAPNWYVETVKEFCFQHQIRFLGKSKLYEKN